jgi:Terminase DNA packaging enzyme
MTNKNLNNAFNIENEDKIFEEDTSIYEEKVDADYEFARKSLMENIIKASDTLEQILELAKASQAPRAYEVATNLIKTIFDGNKDLLELAKRNKDLKQTEYDSNAKNGNVTNNLFVGSTEDLRKLLASEGVGGGLKDKRYEIPTNTTTEGLVLDISKNKIKEE